MAHDFNTVVLIRIVRGGNHHTGDERTRSCQVRNSWGGDDASKSSRNASALEAASDLGREPRPAFSSVHANEDLTRVIVRITSGCLLRPCPECNAQGVSGSGIKRGLTGDAADAISSEKLSRQKCSRTGITCFPIL